MKIIEKNALLPFCAECIGAGDKMLVLGSGINYPVYLCLSCAQKASVKIMAKTSRLG
jgi:hypothetical protein